MYFTIEGQTLKDDSGTEPTIGEISASGARFLHFDTIG